MAATDNLQHWLSAALMAGIPPGPAPADLPPGLAPIGQSLPERAAAVLVPVIAYPGAPSVLFTRRTEHLADHPGQVSFPGGRIEPGDPDPVAAALRETEEELGLARTRIRVVGCLREYRTLTNYRVTPVVGILRPGCTLTPDPEEVADVFEIALSDLRDPAQRRLQSRTVDDIEVSWWVYDCGAHPVWGATAAMLVELCARLDAVS